MPNSGDEPVVFNDLPETISARKLRSIPFLTNEDIMRVSMPYDSNLGYGSARQDSRSESEPNHEEKDHLSEDQSNLIEPN